MAQELSKLFLHGRSHAPSLPGQASHMWEVSRQRVGFRAAHKLRERIAKKRRAFSQAGHYGRRVMPTTQSKEALGIHATTSG
jgi:hypothetical protein